VVAGEVEGGLRHADRQVIAGLGHAENSLAARRVKVPSALGQADAGGAAKLGAGIGGTHSAGSLIERRRAGRRCRGRR
jgi:hypothetical protein